MASIKRINERNFKITISNGYRADGRKISKAKTITIPDTVPRKQIEQITWPSSSNVCSKQGMRSTER